MLAFIFYLLCIYAIVQAQDLKPPEQITKMNRFSVAKKFQEIKEDCCKQCDDPDFWCFICIQMPCTAKGEICQGIVNNAVIRPLKGIASVVWCKKKND